MAVKSIAMEANLLHTFRIWRLYIMLSQRQDKHTLTTITLIYIVEDNKVLYNRLYGRLPYPKEVAKDLLLPIG